MPVPNVGGSWQGQQSGGVSGPSGVPKPFTKRSELPPQTLEDVKQKWQELIETRKQGKPDSAALFELQLCVGSASRNMEAAMTPEQREALDSAAKAFGRGDGEGIGQAIDILNKLFG